MWITACDEAEPTHKSLTIFRNFVEISDLALLAAELLCVPPMPNETESSSTMGASYHRRLASRCCGRHSSGSKLAAVIFDDAFVPLGLTGDPVREYEGN